jgi:hypothetical protein
VNRRELLTRALAIPGVALIAPAISKLEPTTVPVGNHRHVQWWSMPEATWVTAEGEHIVVSQLKDDHLLNTERMLRGESLSSRMTERYWDNARVWLPLMRAEMKRRGLAAKPRWLWDEDA